MARIGLNYLVAAPIPTAPAYGSLPTYGDGFVVGRAIEADINISMNDNNLHADNRVVNVDKSFANGTITLGVDEFGDGDEASQIEVEEILTGGKIVEEDGEKYLDFGESPKLNTVGLGWIVPGRYPDREQKYFETVWYRQVTFGGTGAENAQTKGDNISWNTPTIDGIIKPVPGVNSETNIRRKSRFDTESEAIVWLNTIANIDMTEDQLKGANANELYTLCKKYNITSVTVESETVQITSAASITAATKPAVITAILTAQEAADTPASNNEETDDTNGIGG